MDISLQLFRVWVMDLRDGWVHPGMDGCDAMRCDAMHRGREKMNE